MLTWEMQLFLLSVAAGYLAERYISFNEKIIKIAITVILYLLLPIAITKNFIEISTDIVRDIAEMLVFVIIHFITAVFICRVALQVLKPDNTHGDILCLTIINHNGMFLPLPVMTYLYSLQGAFFTVLYSQIYFIIFIILFPYITYKSAKDVRIFYKNIFPFVFGLLVAFFLVLVYFFLTPENKVIFKAFFSDISPITKAISPLSLFIVGRSFGIKKSGKSDIVWKIVLIKNFIFPIIALVVINIISAELLVRNLFLIEMISSSAVSNVILANLLKYPEKIVGAVVFWTTVFAFISIPVIQSLFL